MERRIFLIRKYLLLYYPTTVEYLDKKQKRITWRYEIIDYINIPLEYINFITYNEMKQLYYNIDYIIKNVFYIEKFDLF